MSPADREWLERYLSARLADRCGNDMTCEMLRRSCAQIAKSENLLRIAVPKVWHPEPQKVIGIKAELGA